MRIAKDSFDDILQDVFSKILKVRDKHQGTNGGPYREQLGAHLILKNPLARASRTESRQKIVSCLCETLWYLSGSDSLEMIEFWVPGYKRHLDDPTATSTPGAYGPRLFGAAWKDSEVQRVISQLKKNPSSRTAVIQMFSNADIKERDAPCTCVLQFFQRGGCLHLVVYMRSNDAFKGLPHDVFAFTWLQEIIARAVGVPLGTYQHMVGSLHIYDLDEVATRQYLDEGWQEVHDSLMPAMPENEPWTAIEWLLETEVSLRIATDAGVIDNDIGGGGIDEYWRDLARLLHIQRLLKIQPLATSVKKKIVQVGKSIISPYYGDFIRRKSAGARKSDGPLFDNKR